MTNTEDRTGRLDLLLLAIGERICAGLTRATGVDVWTPELERELHRQIVDAGVPAAPVNFGATVGDNLARALRGDAPGIQARKRRPRRRRAEGQGVAHVR